MSSFRLLVGGFLLAALGAPQLAAQPLDSLVARAVALHPSIEAARLATARADASARAALALEPPSVGLTFSMLPPGEPNPFAKGETMLMVEQALPLGDSRERMARAMAAGADVAAARLAAEQTNLRSRVEREYYTLWLLERRRQLNRESLDLARTLLKSAEARYMVGRGAQSDLFRITSEIERLGTEAETIETERREARARLNILLERDPETEILVAERLAIDSLPTFAEAESLVAGHPSLEEMEAMARMSEAEAAAQEGMLQPMLMLRGGISYMPEGHPLREGSDMLRSLGGEHGGLAPMENPERFGLTVGAMLSIPIAPWSRSGPEGRAEADRLEAARLREQKEAMRRDMAGELIAAVGQARRARLERNYYVERQIPLLEKTIATLRGDYANGLVPFTSLVEGYTMLVMSHMQAYMKEMELAMATSMIRQMTATTTTAKGGNER